MIRAMLASLAPHQRSARWLGIIAAIGASIAGVALLAVSGWFLTGAALAGVTSIAAVQAFNYLLPSAGIRGLAIARTLMRYSERYYGHKAALLTLAQLRPALFGKIAAADPAASLRLHSGTVANQLGQDVEMIEDGAVRAISLPAVAVTILFSAILIAFVGMMPVLFLLLCVAATTLIARMMVTRRLAPALTAETQALAQYRSRYIEASRNSSDIWVYGYAATVSDTLQQAARALHHSKLHRARIEALMTALHLVVSVFAVAGVIFLAQASVPLVALAALAAAGAMDVIHGLLSWQMQRPNRREAELRLNRLAALPARVASDPISASSSLGLSRNGQTMALPVGARLALVGASGSGKTRLVENLIGLRGDAVGAWQIGGRDAQALPLDARRALFAYAPQDAALLAGTVADNLRLARPGVDEAAMQQALEVACAADFVAALPKGMQSWLGADGARLSGGQRKRLSLARALLAERPWLILDEPSEGLDAATEAELVRQLGEWLDKSGAGLILITHRPAMLALTPDIVTLS